MSAPSMTQNPVRTKMDTRTIVSLAMLTGIAYIVMLVSKLMPSVMFLDFDFKDVVIRRLHLRALRRRHYLYPGGLYRNDHPSAPPVHRLYYERSGHLRLLLYRLFYLQKDAHQEGGCAGARLRRGLLVVVMLLWNYLITPLYMTGFSRADVAALLPTLFLPFNLAKAA